MSPPTRWFAARSPASRRADVAADVAADGASLRAALVERIVALDPDGDASARLAHLDALPDEASWSRWQTVVFAGRAWDDDAAIDLAFALWDVIGEAGYREMLRGEQRRLTIGQRYARPGASDPDANGNEVGARTRVRPVDVGRWAVLELPLALYADLDTGSMSARTRVIGAAVVLLGLGAGVGAGIAALLGRSVETDLAAGVIVSAVLVVGYMLLMISLLAGWGLMASARTRMRVEIDEQSSSPRSRIVTTIWVVAAFVGIASGLAAATVVTMWFQERPYQGAVEQTIGTVLSWDHGHRYRLFQLEYEADGTVRTGEASVDELDLTVYSEMGDTVALEYPVGHPDRIRRAGLAAEGRETNGALARISGLGIAVALACAATAVVVDRRRPLPARP